MLSVLAYLVNACMQLAAVNEIMQCKLMAAFSLMARVSDVHHQGRRSGGELLQPAL